MQITITVLLGLVASLAVASPIEKREDVVAGTSTGTSTTTTAAAAAAVTSAYDWSAGWQKGFPIHASCNVTQTSQLASALEDLMALATHARDHLLRFGRNSEIVLKHFGNGSAAYPAGWYDRVVSADKSAVVLRCDDPDSYCAKSPALAGYWRGVNASAEAAICDAAYSTHRHLDSVCALGYTVSQSSISTFWAGDLLHLSFHLPIIAESYLAHYAEEYDGSLTLAQSDPAESPVNIDTLIYFALEVYAYDIVVPGVGCLGSTGST